MSELSIDRDNLREAFEPASDVDLLKAAEIGGKIAELQKDKFGAAKTAFETAAKAAELTGNCFQK